MRIGILGTGTVGKTLGTKLAKLGHDVRMGSRTAGGEKAKAWVKETGSKSSEGTFADAAAHGEIVFNCTSGKTGFGWKEVIDLGDITGARAQEMYLPLWLRLFTKFKTPNVNIHVAF